jgi:acyl-coenzyme A thioesterase PaaI-like protein
MREPIAPPLPDVFGDRFAGLPEHRAGDGNPFHRCFGCGPAHPTGLHVRSFRSGEEIVSPIVIPREYEGPPGAAHGGIVAAYLDEVLGAAASAGARRPSVTGELTVRYVLPVPTETPLVGHGRVVADHGRYVDVEGRLEALAGGRVLATARGRFFPRKEG